MLTLFFGFYFYSVFCSNLTPFWLNSRSIWDPFGVKKADFFPMTLPELICIDFDRFESSFGQAFDPKSPPGLRKTTFGKVV